MIQTAKRVLTKLIFGDHSLPQNVIKFLEKNGMYTIESGTINRVPLSMKVMAVLNVASFGQFEDNLRNTPYDKLFHLSLDIKLSNGKLIKLEKNERVSISEIRNFGSSKDDLNIDLPNITLNEFINNGYLEMGNKFFSYDGQFNNCQDFLLGLLRGNRCLTPEAQEFIKQDTKELFNHIPWTKSIMDKLTDTASKLSIITQGGKLKHSDIKTYHQFAQYYYHNISKGQTYKQMLQSNKFKQAYKKFKQNNSS